MKKILLFFGIIFIVNINFGQTVYNLDNTAIISDTLSFIGTLTDETIINLAPGIYNQDIFIPISLNTTSVNKLTIKSSTNNAADVVIQSTGNPTIQIKEGYVTIKNITIKAIDNIGIDIMVSQAKSIADKGNITIDSCIINLDLTNTSNAINFMGDFSPTTADNIRITNNIITGGYNGLSIDPYSSIVSGFVIDNNYFELQINSNVLFAFSMDTVRNIEITNNVFNLPINNDPWVNTVGVSLANISNDTAYGTGKTIISNNRFLSNIDSVNYIALDLNSCLAHNEGFIISNNLIDITNTDSSAVGIKIQSCDSLQILHNTIKISSIRGKGVDYNNDGGATPKYLDFKNNIIQSDSICFLSTSSMIDDFDYNVYYSPFINSAFFCEGNAYSIDTWKSTYNLDINSMFENPDFVSFNNAYFNNQTIDNTSPKLPEVDFDINGLVRNSPNCDPGAKEQLFINLGNDTLICFGESFQLSVPTGMFSYLWNTTETSENIIVTTAGTYSVTVQETDGGPIAVDTIIIDYNPEIVTTVSSIINPACFGDNTGLIELNTSGGVAPYSYNWQGAFIDTNKIENLSAGDYYLTLLDNNNCTLDTFFTLTQPDSIQITFSSPTFCGGCTGFIVPTVTGGVEPYTFSWSSGVTDTIAYDLCEGTYTLTIIDNNLCINTDSYSITESSLGYISGTLSYSGGNVSANDGKVELYKYYIDGASQLELVDENILSTGGNFEFTAVEPEEFYLRGIVTSNNSNYDNIYTSYYLNGGDTTAWTGATMISLQCEDTLSNLNFVMYEVVNTLTGPGVFSGTITYNDLNKSAGEPVLGAEVFVEQEPNDEPIANTETDTTGSWDIDNIPVGTGYHIYVDIPGMPLISTYQNLVIESGDTINSDLNFFVDTLAGGGIYSDTATSVIEVNSESVIIKTYPNPVSNYLTIESNFNNNINISYSIIDINGKEVLIKEQNNYQGIYIEKVDVSNLQNGIYFINIKLDNSFFVKKFIKQ